MQKGKINIQDQFVNVARKEKVKVEVSLVTGDVLEGHIRSFDNFCIVVETDVLNLLYKHAIAGIKFLEPMVGVPNFGDHDHEAQ